MTDDLGLPDPYVAVIADLRVKRDEIDRVIEGLLRLCGGSAVMSVVSESPASISVPGDDPRSMFLGMSIGDAAKKLLALKKRPIPVSEIAAALKAGGLMLNGAEPVNVVGSVLMRRFNAGDDIVRVSRGVWGLREWYPGRSFKAAVKPAPASKEDFDRKAEAGALTLADVVGPAAAEPYGYRLGDANPDDDIPF